MSAIRALNVSIDNISIDRGGAVERRSSRRVGIARRGIAIAGVAAMAAVPLAPVAQAQSPPTVTADVRLAAATVPPGGLITSFLGNQVLYCSIICPLVVETVVTASVTTLQTPATFLGALQSGDLFKAIGITAASVTGPTNAAAQAAILADGTIVAPRAFNAFQVGIVGLLNVIPAAADGLPGIARALQTAREDTFTALNAPIVANPTPTVMPRGVLQIAVVEATNVVAAVIFPAFNHVLSAVFDAPDALAQELAATGDPVRALVAGVNSAVGHLIAAGTVIADSVVTALRNIHTAVEESRPANGATEAPDAASAALPVRSTTPTSDAATTALPVRAEAPSRHSTAASSDSDRTDATTTEPPDSDATDSTTDSTPTEPPDSDGTDSTTESTTTEPPDSDATTETSVRATEAPSRHSATTNKDDDNESGSTHASREGTPTLGDTDRDVVKKDSERPHRTEPSEPKAQAAEQSGDGEATRQG